jgi:hypothetical protein
VSYRQQEEAPEFVEGKTDYTKSELQLMADELLREDSRRELCRECLEDGLENPYGDETGAIDSRPLMKQGKQVEDSDGNYVFVDYPELECPVGHRWWFSEGKARGIDGEDPILFEEHLQNRRKREIYTQMGVPDPSIVSGIYNRTHPQGRKVNSADQRKKNGASFYR